MTTISQVAGIVDRAATDPAFRQRLLSAPAAALQEAGIDVPEGSEVRVVENTEGLRHVVLPAKPDGFEDDEPGARASAGPDASAAEKLYAHARLVIDSWDDAGLKARLMSDPAAVMAERGIAVEPGTELRVVEATDRIHYLVLPPAANR